MSSHDDLNAQMREALARRAGSPADADAKDASDATDQNAEAPLGRGGGQDAGEGNAPENRPVTDGAFGHSMNRLLRDAIRRKGQA